MLPRFTFDNLARDPHVAHLFTQKPFNFYDFDGPESSLNQLREQLSYDFHTLKSAHQEHTNHIAVITSDNLSSDFPDTDGLLTNLPGVALATYTADCQAIFLYDPVHQAIGNIHSGWRGTLQRIIEHTIRLMVQEFHSNPHDLQAYICPCILQCCLEIGPEVAEQFRAEFGNTIDQFLSPSPASPDKYLLDTVGLNRHRMESLGIRPESITSANLCTKCNSHLYHSYRTDHAQSGRNLALICLK